jgi:hypothetical protein
MMGCASLNRISAREKGLIARHPDDRVTSRVRRAHLDEKDLLVPNPKLELALEGAIGERELGVSEVEITKRRKRERPCLREQRDSIDPNGVEHPAKHLPASTKRTDQPCCAQQEIVAAWGTFSKVFDAPRSADDFRVGDERVPIAVVAVAVRVDDGLNAIRGGGRATHRREHLGRDLLVEQRVDQQALIPVRDQPGIAPPPRPRQLRIRIDPIPELMQLLLNRGLKDPHKVIR